MEYARVENDDVIERREIESIPAHKAHLWRPVVYEGAGPIEQLIIESDKLRVVLSGIPITANDVRYEAQRRIMALVGAQDINACIVKQLNALMRATELSNKQASGATWTEGESAEAAFLQSMADAIKAIRAASNVMEPDPPIDYVDDIHWP